MRCSRNTRIGWHFYFFFGLQLPFEDAFLPGVGSYPDQHLDDFFAFFADFFTRVFLATVTWTSKLER